MKKLLKYDLRAIARVWWMIAVGVIAISFVGALALRFLLENIDNDEYAFLTIISAFGAFLSIFAIGASMLGTLILVFIRFYKNLFTDEGYLTFTLPVKRSQILLSKTISAMIWTLSHAFLIAIAVMIFLLISPPTSDAGIFNTVVFEELGNLLTFLSGGGFFAALSVIALILIVFGFVLFSVVLIQLCITIASIVAKKAKVALAILIYYIANSALGIAFQIIGILATSAIVSALESVFSSMSEAALSASLVLTLFLIFAIIITISIAIYATTQHLIERKLNLA